MSCVTVLTCLCTHRNLMPGTPCHGVAPSAAFPANSEQWPVRYDVARICQHVMGKEEEDHVVSAGQYRSPYSKKGYCLPGRVFSSPTDLRGVWPVWFRIDPPPPFFPNFSCGVTWKMSPIQLFRTLIRNCKGPFRTMWMQFHDRHYKGCSRAWVSSSTCMNHRTAVTYSTCCRTVST